MARPALRKPERVRVEFTLSIELAEKIYRHADSQGRSLSQTGERLLAHALADVPVD